MPELRHIGLFLFDGVEELDAVGPWEVLSYWTRRWPEDGWRIFTFADHAGPVSCAKGLTIVAEHGDVDRPLLEILVYPGGQGTRAQLEQPTRLSWVRARRGEAAVLVSVCTGSLVYAAAGVLAGRPATTHWASLDRLAELDPSILVRDEERFVDDGDVITAGGISAGIDVALHLVARLAGTSRASQVRRGIQYDPFPPVPNAEG